MKVIREWWAKRKAIKTAAVPESPLWLPHPDLDAQPDDAESSTPLPAPVIDTLRAIVAPVESSRPSGAPRYVVEREYDGEVRRAYPPDGESGEDGVAALECWERYLASDPVEYPGELRFVDAVHGVRNRVMR